MTQKVRVSEDSEHLELPDDVAVTGPVVVANTEGGQAGQGGQLPHGVDRQQVAVQGQCLQVMFNQSFAILGKNSHQAESEQTNGQLCLHFTI